MTEPIPRPLAAKLVTATERLATAEHELESLLRQLEKVERAEKKLIDTPLRIAFDAVSDAKKALHDLLALASE